MIKEDLVEEMLRILISRLEENTVALERSHESMTGESKSSAGDKFETTRAILQSEQDRIKSQIIQNKADISIVKRLNLITHDKVQLGSLVSTEDGMCYFLSIGLGKLKIADTTYYAISPSSPIGQQLIGKREGDNLTFNQMHKTIASIK